MRRLILFAAVIFSTMSCVKAQYGYDNYNYGNAYDDSYRQGRYYYDDEFDWHWDIRVRISDGIQSGLITNSEARRLYNRLEAVENKEYAYTSDGYFDAWEQDEIWEDVAWLNRQLGIQLADNDRVFYGFSRPGYAFSGYPFWYYNGGFDFYRFDRRGFGNITNGYRPRYYHPKTYVYTNRNRYESRVNNYQPRQRNYSNDNYRRDYNRNNDYNRDNDYNRNNNHNRNNNNRHEGNNRSYGSRENGRMNVPNNGNNGNRYDNNRYDNNNNNRYERPQQNPANRQRYESQRIETPRGQGSQSERGNEINTNRGERTTNTAPNRSYPRTESRSNQPSTSRSEGRSASPSTQGERPSSLSRSASREVYHGQNERKSSGSREQ